MNRSRKTKEGRCSVFVDGRVNGTSRAFLLDTGATNTIVRPDVVQGVNTIKPTTWRLRTATGDPDVIHGEVDITLGIGNATFRHQALVAAVEDEVILGLNIMNANGFHLDFQQGALKINNEEMVMHGRMENTVRVVLAEDVVPERCEIILDACPDNKMAGGTKCGRSGGACEDILRGYGEIDKGIL